MILNGSSILVVEDEAAVSALIERILRLEGAIVWTAATGMDALAHIRSEAPCHHVLLDLCLPDIHGWDVLDQIRTIHPASDLPVTILTARADEENEQRATANGVGFISKPFAAGDLVRALGGYVI